MTSLARSTFVGLQDLAFRRDHLQNHPNRHADHAGWPVPNDEAEKILNGARSYIQDFAEAQRDHLGRLKRSLVRCERNIPITET